MRGSVGYYLQFISSLSFGELANEHTYVGRPSRWPPSRSSDLRCFVSLSSCYFTSRLFLHREQAIIAEGSRRGVHISAYRRRRSSSLVESTLLFLIPLFDFASRPGLRAAYGGIAPTLPVAATRTTTEEVIDATHKVRVSLGQGGSCQENNAAAAVVGYWYCFCLS